jgi:hypothetical protein
MTSFRRIAAALEQLVTLLRQDVEACAVDRLEAHAERERQRREYAEQHARETAEGDRVVGEQLALMARSIEQQKAAADDAQRYRDEQREHMRVCALRYEKLIAEGFVPNDDPVKH